MSEHLFCSIRGTMKKSSVRVRIAPSPTGDPHVGTGYMALFNYAFAKKNGGKFILRIEDTDQKRSTLTSEKSILEAVKWLGFSWDEGPDIGGPYSPYRQSERLPIYTKYAQILLENGSAYKCTCSFDRLEEIRKRQQILKQPTGYDGFCRERNHETQEEIKNGSPFVLRLKTPKSGEIIMHDLLRGEIKINATEVDDQVLLKSDGFPTYHLANVVDDHEMAITHVIRGEEWISSLPKHLLLYKAFAWEAPIFCHLPLLRNADKSKVSKRKNPVSLTYYREAGFLPETMANFFGLMAYSMENGEEFFDLATFIEYFDINRISLGGPVFDLKKLTWLNGRYLREKYSNEEIVQYIQDRLFNKEYLSKIIPLIKDRMEKSEDFLDQADFFFRGNVLLSPENYLIEGKSLKESSEIFQAMLDGLETLPTFDEESIKGFLQGFAKDNLLKPKDFFMPIRLMVSGKKSSPPLFETIVVLGKERSRNRIRKAIMALGDL